jgi:hypothetical protein
MSRFDLTNVKGCRSTLLRGPAAPMRRLGYANLKESRSALPTVAEVYVEDANGTHVYSNVKGRLLGCSCRRKRARRRNENFIDILYINLEGGLTRRVERCRERFSSRQITRGSFTHGWAHFFTFTPNTRGAILLLCNNQGHIS